MAFNTTFRGGRPTGTIRWSDGSLFSGWLWVGLSYPTSGGTTWTTVSLKSGKTMPNVYMIEIVDGEHQPNSYLPYNADLVPHTAEYKARYYDKNFVSLTASAGTAFTVTADTFTVPSVTLTVPTAGSVPTPD